MLLATHLITLGALFIPIVSATFNFNATFTDFGGETVDYTIPDSWGISEACTAAYVADIACDKNGLFQTNETSDPKKVLETQCTTECIDGFRKWRDNLREQCSEDDIKAAAAQLTEIGFSTFDATGPQGAITLASVANKQLPAVEMMYWTYCMRDLDSGEFCILDENLNDRTVWQFNDTSFNTPKKTTAFCKMNCLTQASVFSYEISGATYGDDQISIANVAVVCPDLDTSNYPVLLSEKPFSSYSFASPNASTSTSSSSSANSSNATTGTSATTNTSASTNGTTAPDVNAAGSLKGSLWGAGSTVVVAAVAIFMI